LSFVASLTQDFVYERGWAGQLSLKDQGTPVLGIGIVYGSDYLRNMVARKGSRLLLVLVDPEALLRL
jgi:hypothetical protein